MMLRWGQQFNSNGFDLDQRRMAFDIRWVNVEQIKEKIKEEDENITYKSNPSIKGEEGEVDENSDNFSDENNMILSEDHNPVELQSRLHSLYEMYFKVNKTIKDFIKNHQDLSKKSRTLINIF